MVQGSGIAVSCGVGCRLSLDLTLLWYRQAAEAPTLAWELPYAMGAALNTHTHINMYLLKNLKNISVVPLSYLNAVIIY